jgi:hypothetical protein
VAVYTNPGSAVPRLLSSLFILVLFGSPVGVGCATLSGDVHNNLVSVWAKVSTTTGIILSFPLDLISLNTSNPSTLRALELMTWCVPMSAQYCAAVVHSSAVSFSEVQFELLVATTAHTRGSR